MSTEPSSMAENSALKRRREELLIERRALPISEHQDKLVQVVRNKSVVVIVSATGSGKTTQLPQFLLTGNIHKGRMIAVTQPRRVAAVSVSGRVAEELGCRLGSVVGYKIRFEENMSPDTKILYQTDGMLLREAANDSLLMKYAAVLLDEAHERSLATDLLLCVTKSAARKRVQRGYPPLKIVIMSATLDPAPFVKYFGGEEHCQVVWLEGRRFPLELYALSTPVQDYCTAAQITALTLHKKRPITEDILIFLTGEDEIMETVRALKCAASAADDRSLEIHSLYSSLVPSAQQKSLEPSSVGCRKIIVATNIAESSLTIPGVKIVIDCGHSKVKEVRNGLEQLKIKWISQAQAWQRAGRANRQSIGRCYRLFTQPQYKTMPPEPVAEILRCELSGAVLNMLAIGQDPRRLELMDNPGIEVIEEAVELLINLGAAEQLSNESRDVKLTEIGHKMSHFPLAPKMSRVILESARLGCLDDCVKIISCLCQDHSLLNNSCNSDKLDRPRELQEKFQAPQGDLHTLLKIFNCFIAVKGNLEKRRWMRENFIQFRFMSSALRTRRQISEICDKIGLNCVEKGAAQDCDSLVRAFCVGFMMQTAVMQPKLTAAPSHVYQYRFNESTMKLYIHPSSVLFASPPPAVIFVECVKTRKTYMRNVCAVSIDLLNELSLDL